MTTIAVTFSVGFIIMSSYLRTLVRSTFLALLVSLAVNYMAHYGHLVRMGQSYRQRADMHRYVTYLLYCIAFKERPSAQSNCKELSELGRKQEIKTYDEFYPFYLCEHSKVRIL